MLAVFFCRFFFLHISCWLLIWAISLAHPVLASFLYGQFLLHIPCWLLFLFLGSFTYTSRADFIFIWGVSFTHLMLTLVLCGSFSYTSHAGFFSFLFNMGSFFYTSRAAFIFMLGGVSLTHSEQAFFFFLAVTSRAGSFQVYLRSFS